MAQQTNGFSHITVHTDDDEVVIQAGIRPAEQEGCEADKGSAEEAVVKPAATVATPAAAGTPIRTPEPAETAAGPAAAPASDPQPRTDRNAQKAASKPKKKAYRETTAEDLDVGPMPVAQKVVIAVAVLLIVGFLVYYNFLR